jgi:peptidoglycan/LPS O-acetylase OafA/YrhL
MFKHPRLYSSGAFRRASSVLAPVTEMSSREVAMLTSGGRKNDYRADIDGLRAVAVGGVIAYHAFPGWVSGGFVGVDVFFVISGFLISGIIFRDLASGSFSFAEFYRRRIRRIIPALLIVLIATWLIAWLILNADDYAVLGWHLSAASVFLSNLVLGNEAGYFDRAAEYKPLLHLWSLAVEEQFYLIWPVSIYAIWRLHRNPTTVIAVIALLSFGLNIVVAEVQPVWGFYSLPTRLWELALGAVLASSTASVRRKNAAHAMGMTGFGLILIAIFTLKGTANYPGWPALAPTIGTALLVMAGPESWINRTILSPRPVVFIGLISYPLYLWHWPLFSFARYALLHEPTPSQKAGIIALAFLLAWVTYQLVEKPIRFGMRRAQSMRRYAPIALVVLLCGVGVVGLMTRKAQGFVERFPDQVRNLANYTYDQQAAYRVGACILSPPQNERDFALDCMGRAITNDNRPLVFLWGDSHAAHLYPGFARIQGSAGFALAQFTASACPPILDHDVKHIYLDINQVRFCQDINDFVFHKIEELQPQVLVLAAQWWEVPLKDLDKFALTIERLKRAGIQHIIVVGPVPVWNPSLPKLLLQFYQTSVPKHLPDRMRGAALQSDIEQKLQEIAAKEGVGFASAIDVFCRKDECLTKTGNGPGDIVVWDSAHLTDAGSYLLAKRIYTMISADVSNHRK